MQNEIHLQNKEQFTVGPLSIATGPQFLPEFIRLPKPRERDPLFGLSRSYLNVLILPSAENDYRPPVRSVVLRRKGARTGVRLINVQSLREFIERQEAKPEDVCPDHGQNSTQG
jgi:hypothetical protein